MALRSTVLGYVCAYTLLFGALLVGVPLARSASGVSLEGQDAPDFVLKSFSGRNLRLSEYRGEVVMINFWTTWCGTCRQELAMLDAVFRRYRKVGFSLLSVNLDNDREDAELMVENLDLSFPILFDRRKEVSRSYEISRMPSTVLIDREGVVRFLHHGYGKATEDRYLEQLRSLLRE